MHLRFLSSRVLAAPSALLLLALLATAPPARAERLDPALFAGLKARSIGPAAMSGRVSDVEVVESDPEVMYVGAAAGGVWKTVNGGTTWEPIFDDQPVASIGDIAVFQPNPAIVWVGTGEGNVRNSVSIGNGIYKSLDGGRTWKHLGLAETERIHRVVLHPTNPDVAWVAALGRLWGENPERGVFKTTDGGKSWRKVLAVDDKTGAAELVQDPANPDKLFAAMWQFRRWPWGFRSGGPGSGLHVSHDGGESWTRLGTAEGLPAGELGRIGLAISRSNPTVVYALVENRGKNAVLRSDDGGRKFAKVHDENPDVTERPFYYADLKVDPVWPHRVYSLTSRLRVSEDGGRTWKMLGRSRDIHADFHALWIDPKNPELMVAGEDGGLGISRDRGETWAFVGNLPLGQFYHVAVDMDVPYNIYGGLQDNGSWRGPNTTREDGGLLNSHWARVGFGDGFDVRPDPASSRRGYAMWQGGNLLRWDLDRGEQKIIRPADPEGEELRFNWNAALAIDPFEPGTIYYGSQHVHRSRDRGDTWETISPDLTSDNPEWQRKDETGGLTPDVSAAENHTTLVALAPSPVERGVLWAGSDDGRLHVTRDGGATWTSVEKNVRGVPANTWIPHIEPSRFDAASAFVVFDNHRKSDFAPYVYRTDDWGRTWTRLVAEPGSNRSDVRGYALAIAQDTVDRDLLFLGTEIGLWASVDGGKAWMPWRHGVPTTSVMDLLVHPRDGDLVIGTHGRALYVLDDLTPLREATPALLAEPLHLFGIADARLSRANMGSGPSRPGTAEFKGETEPYGALIAYSLDLPGLPAAETATGKDGKKKERRAAEEKPAESATPPAAQPPGEEDVPAPGAAEEEAEEDRDGKKKEPEVAIEISDASGKVVRKLTGPAKRGVQRVAWDLGRDKLKEPPREIPEWRRSQSGPQVAPGTYTVTVRFGGQEAKGTVRVLPDPTGPADAWQGREAALGRAAALQERTVGAIERLLATRADLDAAVAKARKLGDDKPGGKDVIAAGKTLRASLDGLERDLWVPPGTKGLLRDRDLLSKVQGVVSVLDSSWDAPSANHEARLRQAEAAAEAVLAKVEALYAGEVAQFRDKVRTAGIGLLE
ncbi:MAG TPA: hypothetical protein VEG34_01955 [Thermoanaerobaculia bacterium]|nr:hypothetical protein [Thermoanaerobaculia bacterium]